MPRSTLLAPRAPRVVVVPPAGAARDTWVDVAKGLSIVLVVTHHVVLLLGTRHGAPDGLVELSRTLGTVRMPMFFLAAGLFMGRALAGPWRRLLHRRVVLLAWLYVVWSAVRHLVFGILAQGADVERWRGPGALLAQLWLPSSALWFLYALAVFTVLAKVLQRVPVAVRLALAAAVSVVVGSGVVPVESYAWRSMGAYFVFFLLGADASAALRRVAAALTTGQAWATTAVLGLGLVGVLLTVRALSLAPVPGVRLATSLVAVGAGVGLAVALARGPAGRLPAWLGTRTLDVYLGHGLVVAALAPFLAILVPVATGWPLAVGLTAAVTATAVAASLGIARGLRSTGMRWLFALPRPLEPSDLHPAR